MLALALPVMAEEFANLLVGYTDWWLAGQFLPGQAPKAAMGLVAYSLWLLPTLFAAIAIGAQAIVARCIGANDRRSATHAFNQSLLLGALLAIVATTIVHTMAGRFVAMMQLEAEAATLAQSYIAIIAWVLPLIMVEQVASACLRGAGDTWTGFQVKLVVNALNALFSAALVVGVGPLPKLGWEGLAIGTAVGHGVGGLILIFVLLRGRSGLRISMHDLSPDLPLIKRILNVGLPGGFDLLAVIGCHLVYVSIINRLGTTAAAAHGMGVQIEALSYLPGTAFQVAAATLAGQSLGAGSVAAAMQSVRRSWAAATVVMSMAGIAFYFGGPWLTAFFNGGQVDDVTILASRLLKIVAWTCPFLATIGVLTGGLRGAGDTRWPLLVTFAGLIGIRLPLAAIFAWSGQIVPGIPIFGLGWGVEGAWTAMLLDVVVRSILITARFARGTWTRLSV